MNFKFNKGQISLEILVIVLLLIVFVHIYSAMSKTTSDGLEINKIKEQQISIALELNNFIRTQDGFISLPHHNYSLINNSYRISPLNSASQRTSCKIDINSTHTKIYSPIFGGISTIILNNLDNSNIVLPKIFYCDQEIMCSVNGTKIDCN